MRHKLGLAIVCLHISAVLYVLIGGFLIAIATMFNEEIELPMPVAIAGLVLCLALAIGIELVAFGLHRRRFWAWVAGLCIFGIYTPSLFLPLGVLGLWGLLDSGSRAECGVGGAR
jgi:hypothetical protein